MARPIKETPILVGTDAERFICEMQRVENLSKEGRISNREKLMKAYNAAKKRITPELQTKDSGDDVFLPFQPLSANKERKY